MCDVDPRPPTDKPSLYISNENAFHFCCLSWTTKNENNFEDSITNIPVKVIRPDSSYNTTVALLLVVRVMCRIRFATNVR